MSIGQKITCNLYCPWEIKSNPIKVEPILLHIFFGLSRKLVEDILSKYEVWKSLLVPKPSKRWPHKMVKQTQTVRREIVDELFECVWPFYVFGA